MDMSRSKFIAIVVYGLIVWVPASALTLGRLQVNSGVGDPLRAEIEVTRYSAQELQGLTARIASERRYENDGASWSSALSGVATQIEMRDNNRPFIVMTGNSPIHEPSVDVILETQWSTGDLIKRYAVLLNPNANTNIDAPASQPAAESSRQIYSLASTPPESTGLYELNDKRIPVYRFDAPSAAATSSLNSASTVQVTAVKEPVAATALLTEPNAASGQITALQGQTATQLALAHLNGNVTLPQMLMALLKLNPHAFIDGNINLLKAGAQLQIPSAQEAQEMSTEQAQENTDLQNERFSAYTRQMADAPLQVSEKGPGREVSGKVTRKKPQTQDDKGTSQDQLSLATETAKARTQSEKLAQERKEKDARAEIEALKQSLEQLQALSNEKDQPKNTTEPLTPAIENPTPPPTDALENAIPKWLASFDFSTVSQELQIWMAAALAGVVALLLWLFMRRGNKHQTDPGSKRVQSNRPTAEAFEPTGIPPDISSLDLNLNLQPTAPMPTPAQTTEISKLSLATQLLGSGETELATTLLRSVAESSKGDIQSRAMKLLATLP